jgi:hypothetical protein
MAKHTLQDALDLLRQSIQNVYTAGGEPWVLYERYGYDMALISCRGVVDPVPRSTKDSINVARQRNNLWLQDRSWDWTEHPSVWTDYSWNSGNWGYPPGHTPLHVSCGG